MANENLKTIKTKIGAVDGITVTGINSTALANLKSALNTAIGNEASAVAARNSAVSARDSAIAARDAAIKQRDNAIAAGAEETYLLALNAKDADIATLTSRINALTGDVIAAEHAALAAYKAKDMREASLTGVDAQAYTGSAITPLPTVKIGTTTLVKDTDYTLSYSSNTAAGTAVVTATGKGNYFFSKNTSFVIVDDAHNVSKATVAAISAQAYTGSAITPTPAVTIGDTTLVKDTDYTLSYANNTAAGTATVTVTGKGSYYFTKTATFTIVAAGDGE